MTRYYKDIFLGGLLAIGFSLVLWVLIPIAVPVPGSIKVAALSPDYWPKMISAGLVFMGLILMVRSVIGLVRERTAPNRDQEKGAADKIDWPALLRIAGTMFGLLVYYKLVEPLGIVLSSMLALLFFALIYGVRRLKVLIPVVVLLPIGLYYFFVRVANIPMPLGFFN